MNDDLYSFPAFLGYLEASIRETQRAMSDPATSHAGLVAAFDENQALMVARAAAHRYVALVEMAVTA